MSYQNLHREQHPPFQTYRSACEVLHRSEPDRLHRSVIVESVCERMILRADKQTVSTHLLESRMRSLITGVLIYDDQ